MIPRNMQNEVIQMAHSKGHFSIKRTEKVIQQEFYISKLMMKIENISELHTLSVRQQENG